MTARYCVQHFTPAAKRGKPGRMLWLASEPDQRALVVDGISPEAYPDAWTADPTKAYDFHAWPTAAALDGAARSAEAQAVATRAAACIVGATCVRFGDAPEEEAIDFGAQERERVAAARERHADEHMTREEREALGIVTARDRAATVIDEASDGSARVRHVAPDGAISVDAETAATLDAISQQVEADEKRDAERAERAKKAAAAREAAAAKRAERKAEREAQVITAADVGAVPAEPLEDTQ